MDPEEIYIAALKEKACELVETAIRNAQDSLRNLQTGQGEESISEQEYEGENIPWLSGQDFTVELGKKQIEDYVLTWEFHESWLYCTDFLREEDTEFNKLFHYRMRWSIPTCRRPIPRATACVYFTIKISKIKPPTQPVEVYFVFESNNLVHRPGQTRFREKWLKDIIERIEHISCDEDILCWREYVAGKIEDQEILKHACQVLLNKSKCYKVLYIKI